MSAVEVNISCPNVESRGQVFACDPVAAAGVVAAVRRATTPGVPVIVKLSPDVTDIVSVAHSVVTAGACWGGLVDEAPVRLEAGDVLVLPRGDAYFISMAPGMKRREDLTAESPEDFTVSLARPRCTRLGAQRSAVAGCLS